MPLTNFPNGVSSFGQPVYGGERPVMGKQYHVRKTTDANYSSWYSDLQQRYSDGTMSVHTSIESALDVADDFDTIWVYPGQWKPVGTLAITQDSLKLLAVQTGPNKAHTRTEIRQYGNVACDIISINDAHNVEVAGFRLTIYGSVNECAISIAQTAETYGAYIHDNYFYAPLQVGSIMWCGTDTYNADSTAIINNEFWKGGTAGAQATNAAILMTKATKSLFMGNTITQIGGTQEYLYCTDEISNSKILNNVFWGVEAGCVAIHTGTATLGDYCIDGNHFVNYADTASCISGGFSALTTGINYRSGTAITT